MNIPVLYKEITQSKTGKIIPVCTSGRTIESKYDPLRETQKILQTIDENYNFFLLFGVGSGILISELLQKYSDSIILCIENTVQDISFLKNNTDLGKITSTNVHFASIAELKETLIQLYLPAKHGNIKIIENQAWKNENTKIYNHITEQFQQAMQIISADFSVQSHFGKIWQKNIINNIKNIQNKELFISTTKTTAAIIAAGPSLDENINYLKTKKDELFIISTDTTFSTLLNNQITPQIVVSLDGQFISHNHFIHESNLLKNVYFAFDLCSNQSNYKHLPQNNVFFFNTGHPLSTLAIENDCNFPNLFSGAGTVTITAFDLAKYLGFTQFIVLGADFSYINGKPYAKGTYLDSLYNQTSNKLNSIEQLYSKLMFRTEIQILSKKTITTQVLQSYKKSFEEYLKNNNLDFTKKADIYEVSSKNRTFSSSIIKKQISNKIDFATFLNNVKENYNNNNYIFLLPYVANLRKQFPHKTFLELLKLAYSTFSSYN